MSEISQANVSKLPPWINQRMEEAGFHPSFTAKTLILTYKEEGFLIGNFADSHQAFLSYIYVEPPFRNHGAGSQLLDRFLSIVRDRGMKEVQISGSTGNAPGYLQPGIKVEKEKEAIRLVKRFGFIEIGLAYSMERDLRTFMIKDELTSLEIRMPFADEIPSLERAIESSVPGDWSQLFAHRVQHNPHQVLIAVRSGEIVGYATWQASRFGPIGVLHNQRGQGIGRKLVLKSLEQMVKQGEKLAWFLWSDDKNLKFYLDLGFTVRESYARYTLFLN